MEHVLVVEDSRAIGKLLCAKIRNQGRFLPLHAESRERALELLETHRQTLFMALADLNLPDAPHGEVVDDLLARKLPTVVLTGMYDPSVRDAMVEKEIADFILKQESKDLDYAVETLARLDDNRKVTILVVDDSRTFRSYLKSLLQHQLYRVLEAKNGREGLEVLEAHPEVKLVLTDYNMPEMDGYDLTQEIRKRYPKEEMGIIAVSGEENKTISSKFLKFGASDYIIKNFSKEEFFCRVNLNLEALKAIEKSRKMAEEIQRIHDYSVREQEKAHHKQKSIVVNDLENDPSFLTRILYRPSDILSGDTYSIHRAKDGGLLVYLVDAMGHGILPSLTSFAVSSTVKQFIDKTEGLEQLLAAFASSMKKVLDEMEQVSFTFLYIDGAGKTVEYAIGGMYPALVADGEKIHSLKANNLPFMNFMEEITIDKIPLEGFSKLLVYSDGLVEDERVGYDTEDVKSLLDRSLLEWTLTRLKAEPLEDDTTVLYVEKR